MIEPVEITFFEFVVVSIRPDGHSTTGNTVTLDAPDLFKYLGKPVFDESQIKVAAIPGTAIGLAWTSMGGDTLLIEATSFAGKTGLVLTGQMGDVMKGTLGSFFWKV